jgi:hypothetical protein
MSISTRESWLEVVGVRMLDESAEFEFDGMCKKGVAVGGDGNDEVGNEDDGMYVVEKKSDICVKPKVAMSWSK